MTPGDRFAPVAADPDRLRAVARALRDVAGDLAERVPELDAAVERCGQAVWTGPRAWDFRFVAAGVDHAVAGAVEAVADLADAVSSLAEAASTAHDEVELQGRRAAAATQEAESRVRLLVPGDPQAEVEREHARGVERRCVDLAAEARSAYDAAARLAAARIDEVADRAAGVVPATDPATLGGRRVSGARVATAWAVLDGWLHPELDLGGPGGLARLVERLASLTTASQAFAWWRSLSVLQQQVVLRERPDLVGTRDGIPSWARDLANRVRLGPVRQAAGEQLRARLDQLAHWPAEPTGPRFRQGTARSDVLADVDRLREELHALDALTAVLRRPGRRLLSLDVAPGRRVHAAVAVGDVDHADNVAVFTPGFGSSVQDGVGDYDTKMASLRTLAEADGAPGGATTATVTWLGYDAPQVGGLLDGARSVASSHLAEEGAAGLAGFLHGIDASRPQGVHLVALGHSYGSSTTGYALARERTGTDDVALFGSPGDGVDHVRDLHVPARHLYVEAASGDMIPSGRFGQDPRRTPGFERLEVGAASPYGDETRGHTHYLDPGTASQWNLAAVVAGREDLLVEASPAEQPDVLRHVW